MAGRAYGEGSEIAQLRPHSSDERSVKLSDRVEQCERTSEEFAKSGFHSGPSFLLRMIRNCRLIETAGH